MSSSQSRSLENSGIAPPPGLRAPVLPQNWADAADSILRHSRLSGSSESGTVRRDSQNPDDSNNTQSNNHNNNNSTSGSNGANAWLRVNTDANNASHSNASTAPANPMPAIVGTNANNTTNNNTNDNSLANSLSYNSRTATRKSSASQHVDDDAPDVTELLRRVNENSQNSGSTNINASGGILSVGSTPQANNTPHSGNTPSSYQNNNVQNTVAGQQTQQQTVSSVAPPLSSANNNNNNNNNNVPALSPFTSLQPPPRSNTTNTTTTNNNDHNKDSNAESLSIRSQEDQQHKSNENSFRSSSNVNETEGLWTGAASASATMTAFRNQLHSVMQMLPPETQNYSSNYQQQGNFGGRGGRGGGRGGRGGGQQHNQQQQQSSNNPTATSAAETQSRLVSSAIQQMTTTTTQQSTQQQQQQQPSTASSSSTWTDLTSLRGHFLEFALDTEGSKMLQRLMINPQTVEQVFHELVKHVVRLSCHSSGNYAVQRMIEFGNDAQRLQVIKNMRGHCLDFAEDLYGCRVLQRLMEIILPARYPSKAAVQKEQQQQQQTSSSSSGELQNFIQIQMQHVSPLRVTGVNVPPQIQLQHQQQQQQQQQYSSHSHQHQQPQNYLTTTPSASWPLVQETVSFLSELSENMIRVIRDQNANHVVQKMLDKCSPITFPTGFLIDIFATNMLELGFHCYGCRVAQKVFEVCHDGTNIEVPENAETLDKMYRAVQTNLEKLVFDQYGNYVVQHMIAHAPTHHRRQIYTKLVPQIQNLACNKFGSNIVERMLMHAATPEELDEVMFAISSPPTTSQNQQQPPPPVIVTLMKDQFANYVVQKVLDLAKPNHRDRLIPVILEYTNYIRDSTFGQHMLYKVEKAGWATGIASAVPPPPVGGSHGGGGHYHQNQQYQQGGSYTNQQNRGGGYQQQQQGGGGYYTSNQQQQGYYSGGGRGGGRGGGMRGGRGGNYNSNYNNQQQQQQYGGDSNMGGWNNQNQNVNMNTNANAPYSSNPQNFNNNTNSFAQQQQQPPPGGYFFGNQQQVQQQQVQAQPQFLHQQQQQPSSGSSFGIPAQPQFAQFPSYANSTTSGSYSSQSGQNIESGSFEMPQQPQFTQQQTQQQQQQGARTPPHPMAFSSGNNNQQQQQPSFAAQQYASLFHGGSDNNQQENNTNVQPMFEAMQAAARASIEASGAGSHDPTTLAFVAAMAASSVVGNVVSGNNSPHTANSPTGSGAFSRSNSTQNLKPTAETTTSTTTNNDGESGKTETNTQQNNTNATVAKKVSPSSTPRRHNDPYSSRQNSSS